MIGMLLTVLLTGCGDPGRKGAAVKNAAPGKTSTKDAPPAAPPTGVEVVIARRDTVADQIAVTGHIEAVQAIDLRPEAAGRIVQLLVREGQSVARGTPLFKIDDAELRAQVARAAAERDLARQTLDRTKALLAQNASATADLERAEATARGAQAQLDQLSVQLARTTVRAPFAGVTGQRFVSLGDYVTPATKLVSLQATNPERAVLSVPERYAAELKRGQRVAFTVAAFPGAHFSAAVEFVDPVVELPARTITVKALAPNPDGGLQPGMFIEARLATAVRTAAVVIPEDAVMPNLGGTNAVWVVHGGKAIRRDVTLGVRSFGFVEVARGIAAGEPVVVGGLMQLSEGAPVKATVVPRARTAPAMTDSGPGATQNVTQ